MSTTTRDRSTAICDAAEARRRAPGDRAGLSVDVERARRRPPPSPPLLEAGHPQAGAESAGYEIELLSPFNSLLFPPIAAVRLAGKLTGKDDSDDAMPLGAGQQALDRIFGLERELVGRVPFPFGVSLVAVLRRPR